MLKHNLRPSAAELVQNVADLAVDLACLADHQALSRIPVVDRAVAAVDVPACRADDRLDQIDQVLAGVARTDPRSAQRARGAVEATAEALGLAPPGRFNEPPLVRSCAGVAALVWANRFSRAIRLLICWLSCSSRMRRLAQQVLALRRRELLVGLEILVEREKLPGSRVGLFVRRLGPVPQGRMDRFAKLGACAGAGACFAAWSGLSSVQKRSHSPCIDRRFSGVQVSLDVCGGVC